MTTDRAIMDIGIGIALGIPVGLLSVWIMWKTVLKKLVT